MSVHHPVRFEALTGPRQSWNRAGFRVIVGVVLVGSTAATTVFWLLGAWPVAGFMGVEVAAVLALLLAHRRWSSRAAERILLADGMVRVRRVDGRGRTESADLDAYWTRVRLQDRPGRIAELRLTDRGRSIEVGAFLPEEEKGELAAALADALARHRSPTFDNPQLRP